MVPCESQESRTRTCASVARLARLELAIKVGNDRHTQHQERTGGHGERVFKLRHRPVKLNVDAPDPVHTGAGKRNGDGREHSETVGLDGSRGE